MDVLTTTPGVGGKPPKEGAIPDKWGTANGRNMEWPDPLWIFGYGSIAWKVDFDYEERMVGYVDGFKRRFWQGSPDHRGTETAPGRVVTLVKDVSSHVWGFAFRIAPEKADEVMLHLDYREKGGYAAHRVTVHPLQDHHKPAGGGNNSSDNSRENASSAPPHGPVDAIVYLATDDNVEFLGDAPLDEIAAQIYRSVGPSGTNKEYLYNLAAAMRELVPDCDDDHLFELEKRVKALDEAKQRQ